MNCLSCNQELIGWEELDLAHCEHCGYSYQLYAPSNPYLTDPSFADHFYQLDNTFPSKALSCLRLGLIQSAGVTSGRIVDLGCSVGSFMEISRNYGYEVKGMDISCWSIEKAILKGLEVYLKDLAELDGEFNQINCFTLFDVIEHLPEPDLLLSKLYRLLLKDGIIVLSTPNANGITRDLFPSWRHFKPREHIHYFTSQAMISFLEKTGFKVILETNLESEIRINPDRPFNNIMTFIAKKLL